MDIMKEFGYSVFDQEKYSKSIHKLWHNHFNVIISL